MKSSDIESLKNQLQVLQEGDVDLNDYRKGLLMRVPETGDWAAFQTPIDLTDPLWLAAKTRDHFVLFQCNGYEILLHGGQNSSDVKGVLFDMLGDKKARVVATYAPGSMEVEV